MLKSLFDTRCMNTSLKLQLDRYIPALINFFSNKMSNGASQLYAFLFDMGVTDWRILSLLAVEENIPASRICHVIGLDKSAVSRSLAKLQERGYIEMTVDKKDSRAKKNKLTPAGLAMYEKMYHVAKEREEKFLEVLSDEDQEHLIRILNILNSEINDINEFFMEKYIQK